jgi:DMSO/TMAO reductase YedYZ heme-binding membrane subunit
MNDAFLDSHTWLLLGLFCIWYMIVHSSAMIEQVLSKTEGAVSSGVTTTKGTLMQMALTVGGYAILIMIISTLMS